MQEDSGEASGPRGPLTWAGGTAVSGRPRGVGAGPWAGDPLTAHLSQLGKHKDTQEEAQIITPPRTVPPQKSALFHPQKYLGTEALRNPQRGRVPLNPKVFWLLFKVGKREKDGLLCAKGTQRFAKGQKASSSPQAPLTWHVHWVQGSSSKVNTWPFTTFLPS